MSNLNRGRRVRHKNTITAVPKYHTPERLNLYIMLLIGIRLVVEYEHLIYS